MKECQAGGRHSASCEPTSCHSQGYVGSYLFHASEIEGSVARWDCELCRPPGSGDCGAGPVADATGRSCAALRAELNLRPEAETRTAVGVISCAALRAEVNFKAGGRHRNCRWCQPPELIEGNARPEADTVRHARLLIRVDGMCFHRYYFRQADISAVLQVPFRFVRRQLGKCIA